MKIIGFRAGIFLANCYILYDEGENALVIDPGGNYDRIVAETQAVHKKIGAVLLTHGHFDHMGAAKRLQDDGVPIYIHERDFEKCYTDGNLAKLMRPDYDFESFIPDFSVKDGQVLDLCGFEVRVINTPGHSSGSCCFVIEDCIFSGDTLFSGCVGRTDLPDGDQDVLVASIRDKLFTLQKDYRVFPGHLEPTTLFYEKENNGYSLWGGRIR